VAVPSEGPGGGATATVPTDVIVTAESDNGGISVSGVAGVNLDSGGGPITAAQITGPLTLTSEDGSVTLNSVTGDLEADTGGGSIAGDVTAARATVLTGDGSAALSFGGAPGYVFLDTGGGPAQLSFDPAADHGAAHDR